jgi:hypothetical protein
VEGLREQFSSELEATLYRHLRSGALRWHLILLARDKEAMVVVERKGFGSQGVVVRKGV